MKILLAVLAAGTVLSAPAFAADLDPVASPDVYRYFVAVKGGYGPSLIDNDYSGAGSSGKFDDDHIVGGSLEAGVFLSERMRLSFEVNYGKLEHDTQVVNFRGAAAPLSGRFALEGQTNIFQGFVKAAYEMPLSDLGFSAPIFERSSIVALGGIGFTHLDTNGVLNLPAAVGGPGFQQEEDIVLSGKVGLGSVYRLTDRIDLVSETSFIFGQDATLTTVNLAGTSTSEVETQAIVSQLGIRFKF